MTGQRSSGRATRRKVLSLSGTAAGVSVLPHSVHATSEEVTRTRFGEVGIVYDIEGISKHRGDIMYTNYDNFSRYWINQSGTMSVVDTSEDAELLGLFEKSSELVRTAEIDNAPQEWTPPYAKYSVPTKLSDDFRPILQAPRSDSVEPPSISITFEQSTLEVESAGKRHSVRDGSTGELVLDQRTVSIDRYRKDPVSLRATPRILARNHGTVSVTSVTPEAE